MAATAAHQLGLISRDQLRAIGFSDTAIARMVAAGLLRRVLQGVFGVAGTPGGMEEHLMAAYLWAGEGSAVSHRAAARKWGFWGFDGAPVEVSTTIRRRASGLLLPDGTPVVVHRVDENLLKDIEYVGPLPVTSIRRTIMDIAGRKNPRAGRALDDALFKKLVTLGQIWTLYDEEWTRGRRGIAIVRTMLRERSGPWVPTQTDLEDMYSGIVVDFSLPEPIRQFRVHFPDEPEPRRLDFAHPGVLLDIECDSHSFHGDWAACERDRDRDNKLRAMGWTVLRFTWAKLKYERAEVAAIVQAVYHRLSGAE
ncbi:MAG: type IV toxin-antitoxin system AbiEi family antitoxin domain-containing protein [Actinomycetota bacterium]